MLFKQNNTLPNAGRYISRPRSNIIKHLTFILLNASVNVLYILSTEYYKLVYFSYTLFLVFRNILGTFCDKKRNQNKMNFLCFISKCGTNNYKHQSKKMRF